MKRSEIHDMSNTDLIMILCKAYAKRNDSRSAKENAQKVIDELESRSLVYGEDLEEEFFK